MPSSYFWLRTSENPQNANFAKTEFSEVRFESNSRPLVYRLAGSLEKCQKRRTAIHRIHRELIAACFHQATHQPARERGIEMATTR
jgi:hypothetical protein